jgi:fumarate reductase flavoprotein subunit
MEGGFQVNLNGKRFGNESNGYSEQALELLAQPGRVAWDIYDRRLHLLGLSFEDYRQAVEAGAIRPADTIEDLAHELGLPEDALAQTLADYHQFADGVRADPFGREESRRLAGSFYGAKVTAALFHTQGGLIVNRDAQVTRADGTCIPNLYAGGGVAAGLSGHGAGGYFSGNGLLTAIGYGMLAGIHASQTIKIESGEG